MSATQRIQLQPCYLLHRRPFRDSSQLLEIFSLDYGRISLVGRGVSRRRRGGSLGSLLQPFRPLLVSYSSRGDLGTLTGVESGGESARTPEGERLFSALYLNELLTRLLHRHEAHRDLFAGYASAIEALCCGQPLAPTLRRFEFALLDALGYGVDLEHDADQGVPLDSQTLYRVEPEQGVRVAREVREGEEGLFRGEELLAIAHGDFAGHRASPALRLTRQLLAPYLGVEPLRSRALFRSARSGGGQGQGQGQGAGG